MSTRVGGSPESDSNAVCAAFAAPLFECIGAGLPSTFSLALSNPVAGAEAGDGDGNEDEDGAGPRGNVDAESVEDCSSPLGAGAFVDGFTCEREL